MDGAWRAAEGVMRDGGGGDDRGRDAGLSAVPAGHPAGRGHAASPGAEAKGRGQGRDGADPRRLPPDDPQDAEQGELAREEALRADEELRRFWVWVGKRPPG